MEILRTGNKILWKRGEIAIFNMSLTSEVKLHIHLLNVVVQFIVFLTSATLIFQGMDISKCFRQSLGIRDNESRLYYFFCCCFHKLIFYIECLNFLTHPKVLLVLRFYSPVNPMGTC